LTKYAGPVGLTKKKKQNKKVTKKNLGGERTWGGEETRWVFRQGKRKESRLPSETRALKTTYPQKICKKGGDGHRGEKRPH